MNKLIEDIKVGSRTICGTDWPIYDELRRTGEREWTVVRELCNGVPRTSETYRSEKAAREAFGSRIEGRKPRAGAAGKPITFRATADERAKYEAAAQSQEKSLGEWLRDAADMALAGSK